ncbi:hypothetical protein BX666DRAFT_1987199 [Dichotomocladium elegans]|nr:hypothetical protein BX666DRAFT_1987199 [Dichotomocladium elegans]
MNLMYWTNSICQRMGMYDRTKAALTPTDLYVVLLRGDHGHSSYVHVVRYMVLIFS